MQTLPTNFTPHKPFSLESLKQLEFGERNSYYLVQPKLDGLRCLITQRGLLSNTLKPIPNLKLQKIFIPFCQWLSASFVEGELIVHKGNHQDTQSIIMSEDKDPKDVVFMAFDRFIGTFNPYKERYQWARQAIEMFAPGFPEGMLRVIHSHSAYSLDAVEEYEKFYCEDLGHEGIIIRNPSAVYKFGRATFNEDSLYKYKRTEDAEAEILDVIELETNLNKQESDERGYAKRSSHQANLIGIGSAGSLLVRGINGRYEGKTFRVSLGSCTLKEREWHWQERSKNVGRTITYIFAKYRGTDDAPAEPRLKGFRKDI